MLPPDHREQATAVPMLARALSTSSKQPQSTRVSAPALTM
jgi:hypothetical protein